MYFVEEISKHLSQCAGQNGAFIKPGFSSAISLSSECDAVGNRAPFDLQPGVKSMGKYSALGI